MNSRWLWQVMMMLNRIGNMARELRRIKQIDYKNREAVRGIETAESDDHYLTDSLTGNSRCSKSSVVRASDLTVDLTRYFLVTR